MLFSTTHTITHPGPSMSLLGPFMAKSGKQAKTKEKPIKKPRPFTGARQWQLVLTGVVSCPVFPLAQVVKNVPAMLHGDANGTNVTDP